MELSTSNTLQLPGQDPISPLLAPPQSQLSATQSADRPTLHSQQQHPLHKQSRSSSWFTANNIVPVRPKTANLKQSLTLDEQLGLLKNPSSSSSKPKPPPQSQFSVLHAAAVSGDKLGLQKLVAANFCDINLQDKFGRTPLTFAVLGDFPECAETLLKNGGSAQIADRSGRTPLHWAAHHGHFSCLKLLLTHCKKQNLHWGVPDQGGVTVLHLATRRPEQKCLPVVLKHLNSSNIGIDAQDKNNRTPLHWAASQGSFEYVKILLKHGAQVQAIDVEGKTPLHWIASCSESTGNANRDPVKTIKMLVEASNGAPLINCQDYEGRIPLHLGM